MQTITRASDETINLGKKIAEGFHGGDIVCLYGELGTGKTTLVKGIAKGLGVKNEITSPTFTLMNVYDIKTLKHKNIRTMVHVDTYRLKDEEELIEIGVEDYLGQSDTVCIIEWPEKIERLIMSMHTIKIILTHGTGTERNIEIL